MKCKPTGILTHLTIFLLLIIFGSGCINMAKEMKDASITEQASIDEVLNLYGGKFSYEVNVSTDLDNPTTTSYELKLQNCPSADQFKRYPEILSGGVAMHFYKKLRKPAMCKEISAKIVFASGESITHLYSAGIIKRALRQIPQLDRIYTMIKEQRFDSLKNELHPESHFMSYDKDSLVSYVKIANDKIQKYDNLFIVGFREKLVDNHPYMEVSGLIQYGDKWSPLSAIINMEQGSLSYLSFAF